MPTILSDASNEAPSHSLCLIVGHFRSACGLQRVADIMALEMEAKKEDILRVDVAQNFNWSVTLPRNDVFDLSQVTSYQPARIICPLIVAGNALPVFELLRDIFGEQTPIIPFCHWEMTRFPESWRKVAEMAAEVWLPTPFVKSAFDSTFPDLADKSRIFQNPVEIDPFPVTRPQARESARRIFDLPVNAFVAGFTFASSSCFDRKNPFGAIQAFRQAFGDRSTNFLLIRCTDPDFYPEGLANLRRAVNEVEGLRLILKGEPQHRLEDFYAGIDVLVSLHRSEGYGLTIAEAVQTGAHAISTEWGLAPELAALPRVHTVSQKLIPVHDLQGFFGNFAHLEWADPNLDEAADCLLQIADEIGNSSLTAPFTGMVVSDGCAVSPSCAPTVQIRKPMLETGKALFKLTTYHETELYFDEETRQICHARGDKFPKNLVLEIIDRRGRLLVFGSSFAHVCQVHFFAEKKKLDLQKGVSELNLDIARIDNQTIAIQNNGFFLAADSDGIVRNDREWCREWEKFKIDDLSGLCNQQFQFSGIDDPTKVPLCDLLFNVPYERNMSTLPSFVCCSDHFDLNWYGRWAKRIGYGNPDLGQFGEGFARTNAKVWDAMQFKDGVPLYRHRKMWEWCAIAQVLDERNKLRPGKRGCGFAVGHEPLPSLFAACGAEILVPIYIQVLAMLGVLRANRLTHLRRSDGQT